MADEHYQKSDQEVAQIQSAITGLEKRLNDAQSELENGQQNLHRLEQAFYLDLFTKTMNQYQKKAVDLAKIIDKIHALGRYVDHATFRGNTVSQHGQFSLPSFRGMSCTPNKFLDQNCIDIDAGLKALKSEFKKLGIIDQRSTMAGSDYCEVSACTPARWHSLPPFLWRTRVTVRSRRYVFHRAKSATLFFR
ncbi:MAG: hypothetical protein N0C88_11730 [Candidatus Thiodiazotropha lotti]|uniref:Uncharacterized protein n=1 Tax=Candidatus Thiodiazotropha lotti TaxID=2792787 RepID=A0A9E4N1C5_9GAMM|nr:hypothetical protein [Candidatus Thiodiazotropha lotti]MCW4203972.1 hypothetical protein [Candidatus Thiodiazotropha lotti]